MIKLSDAADQVADAISAARETGSGFKAACQALDIDHREVEAAVKAQVKRMNGDGTVDAGVLHGILIGIVSRQSASEDGTDWERLATELLHPKQRAIVNYLRIHKQGSPNEMSKALGEGLSQISYHVKVLFDAENKEKPSLLKLVGTEPRRGAVEHFYALRAKPLYRTKKKRKGAK